MGAGRGGIEDDVDIGERRHVDQASHARGARGNAKPGCARKAIRGGVDADHYAHFEVFAMAQDLDHQVRADIAGADDRGLQCLGHDCFR